MESRSYPFGRDVDTLVLCLDEYHRAMVIHAFGLKAQYEFGMPALTGRRYEKVIVFTPSFTTATQEETFKRYYSETLCTQVSVGGKIYLV